MADKHLCTMVTGHGLRNPRYEGPIFSMASPSKIHENEQNASEGPCDWDLTQNSMARACIMGEKVGKYWHVCILAAEGASGILIFPWLIASYKTSKVPAKSLVAMYIPTFW